MKNQVKTDEKLLFPGIGAKIMPGDILSLQPPTEDLRNCWKPAVNSTAAYRLAGSFLHGSNIKSGNHLASDSRTQPDDTSLITRV